jgi:hypothetical protein
MLMLWLNCWMQVPIRMTLTKRSSRCDSLL